MVGLPPDDVPAFWMEMRPSPGQTDADMCRHPSVFQMSREGVLQLCAVEILNRQLGFEASAAARKGLLGSGEPIPMMSYGLVEYMMGIDLSSFAVLEIGGGNSTFFWASRTRSVLTLEHDPEWLERVSAHLPSNVDIVRVDQDEYPSYISTLSLTFDLIVIDCAANRYACAIAAGGKLNVGGLVILDNSDWYPNTASALRELGLIQVDYADFRPDHWYRCCSSIFIHPDYRPKPLTDRLPAPVLGGKDLTSKAWDRPQEAAINRR